MKKFLYFTFFLLLSFHLSAQLDREHWFAPMIDRTANPEPYQTLYLSTNQTVPFPVNIYNNNIIIGTVNLSKGNPQKFPIPRDMIITTLQTDLFKSVSKGIYLKADRPFFANLRFSVYNHAEIVTSKGVASIGKKFYAAMAPITVSNPILSFMTSVMATENNTAVTISGYNVTTQFSDGLPHPSFSFILNKGQSYIIDGIGDIAANGTGFIGAKIVSDKPVSVTNGNFNGQFAGDYPTSSDILMDQSLPVNQLGKEFALVKGNGSIGSNMEGAIVIATEDNTEIYVNNEGLPIATINEGKYFVIPDLKYQAQGVNNHYNLYIKTTKNAYVYQLLAGNSGASEVATGGFNFIPALSCYLPKKIDELGLIDENFVFSNGNPTGILNIPTKLNLITEVGATVLINGVAPPITSGPYPMVGTVNWVTYGVPNVSGNLTITSTKAITAGINAGSDAIGYGGFFAGFPTAPLILKTTGDCIPGIGLAIDPDIYETYQWLLNGNPIPGATNSTIIPTQPGYYSASVTIGSCPALIAPQFPVLNCTFNAANNYSICGPLIITPAFSSSTQTIVPSTVTITAAPTQGVVFINTATGVITYTPNPGTSGTDTFTYKFCGNDPVFTDCESITANIIIGNLIVNNTTIKACNINGNGTFDLTTANITTQTTSSIKFYPTFLDAQNENTTAEILNTTNYPSAGGTIIYATVKTVEGCKKIANITLDLFPLAVVANYTASNCDDNVDGLINVDLSAITAIVLPNFAYFNVKYYTTLAFANAGGTNNLPNNWTYSANTTIYIRVESPDGCAPVIKALQFNIGNKVPLLITNSTQSECDDDLDGSKLVNLSIYNSLYTNDSAVNITYFDTLANAQNNVGALTNPVIVTLTKTFYLRFQKAGLCPEIATITINIKIPNKSLVLQDQVICAGLFNAVLDAGPGFTAYLWNTGATTPSITVGIGTYYVDLTAPNGCVYRQSVIVTETPSPVITAIDVQANGTVTVTVTGGNPPYQYALDNPTNWQFSNIFLHVPKGLHTVYVTGADNCSVVKKEFNIINLINTITPNGDGINEVLDYSELKTKDDVVFRVFDRYGAEVFRGDRSNNYIWDGTIKGRPVPTATYWFILQYKEFGVSLNVNYSGWILVKHRNTSYFNN